jgi:hypothetical protein
MTRNQAQALVRALKKEFHGNAEFERVNNRGRYRFAVTSEHFAKMPQLRRQDAAWKVVEQTLPREATLDVSIILAFAPADLAAGAVH